MVLTGTKPRMNALPVRSKRAALCMPNIPERQMTEDQFDEIKQSPRQATVTDVEDLCDEIDRLRAALADMVKELQWERGRPPGKITLHWMRAAFDRVAAGEPEQKVMRDFGYELSNVGGNGRP